MKRSAWALFLCCLAISQRAAGQTPADVARSKELFRAGASAYAAGDYAAAIQALEAAYELTPLPAIGFSLAQAERKQYMTSGRRQHLERAVSLFRRYLEEAPSGNRRGDAEEALAQLVPHLPAPQVSSEKPTPAMRPSRLMIIAEAPGARISLDGAAEAPSPLVREVTPGKHRVRVSAPGFKTFERDTTAVAGELVLNEVHLNEQPVALHVYTPPHSEVYVDGAFAGESDGRLALALPAGEHDVSVLAKGRRAEHQRVRLVRGQPLSIRVSPDLSTQRIVSLSLLCAAGAAAGAGVVLSAFAVRSQNRAEDFLGERAQHPVSSVELAVYQASVNERDRLRFGSALGFASAAGFLITGLFLHELDRPAASERRTPALPRASLARSETKLGVVPLAPTGDAGASLLFRF